MSKAMVLLLLLSIFLCSQAVIAKHNMHDLSKNETVLTIPKSLLYNEVEITLKDGSIIRGLLSEIRKDTLVCLVREGKKFLAYNEMHKLTIFDVEKDLNDIILAGMFSGIFIGHLIFLQADEQPTAYITTDYPEGMGAILANLAFAAGGLTIGYWISLGIPSRVSFNFSGDHKDADAAWNRLRSFIKTEQLPKKVNLAIYAGHVSPRISDNYRNIMNSTGFQIDDHYSASNFNLLRKLQFTYKLNPCYQVGAAVIWQGEPSFYSWKSESDVQGYESSSIQFNLDARGYYAIFIYNPLPTSSKSGFSWDLGLGLGITAANLNITGDYHSGTHTEPYEYFETKLDYHWKKKIVSSVLFTEIHYYLYSSLSLAVYADYTLSTKQDLPGIPELDITQQNLSFGNYSFGFSFGLHF